MTEYNFHGFKSAYEWMAAGFPVLGHVCPKLTEIQSLIDSYGEGIHPRESPQGCEANILPDGLLRGCDGTNAVPISFCPGCGVALKREAQS